MKMYLTFTGKELVEQWRSFRLLILFAVLTAFAMLSPVLAKMMPDIFAGMDMGVQFTIPEPTFLDAYSQYFKNMTQMAVLVVLLLFSGNITGELQKGTAILMLSKGLPKSTFIAAKLSAQVSLWTLAYAVSAAICYGYTAYLFPEQAPQNLLLSLFCLWLLVVFVLCVLTLMSVLFLHGYAPLLGTAGVLILLLILGSFPQTTKYSPLALGSCNMELIGGTKGIGDVALPLLITAGLAAACILAAIRVFRKRQL